MTFVSKSVDIKRCQQARARIGAWENCSNLQVTWEPTSSLLYASKKLKQYHKKEREIRVAAEAADSTNGLGDAPSLAFIETDLAALMLSDPARLGVKL